jgi:hypothetical protein
VRKEGMIEKIGCHWGPVVALQARRLRAFVRV